MPKKTRVSKARNIAARMRGQQAIKLRMAGATLDDIAKELEFKSAASAYKSVMRELKATAQDMGEGIEAVRQLELNRLDQMQLPLWPQVLDGDIAATTTALRIQERRASLLGLDAPKQIEARVRIDVLSWNQAIRDFLDVYRELHSNAPEAPKLLERIDKLAEERFAGVAS
jgi:exonuclease VII large subunit